MDWKREAIEKLRGYNAKKNALTSIPDEIRTLEAAATSIRSAQVDGTPVKGGGSGREDMLLSNIAKRQELEVNLGYAQDWIRIVDLALGLLSEQERLVLDRFYINRPSGYITRLCEDLCVEQATVYRMKDSALRKFTQALYGLTET